MQKIIDKIFLNCQRATLYTLMREEGKLCLFKCFQLRLHYIVCSFCKLFKMQNKTINKAAKAYKHQADKQLSANRKQELQNMIEEQIKK